MQEIKEILKSDMSHSGAKRLRVTLTVDRHLPRDKCKRQALKLLETYRDDEYCRDSIVESYFLGKVAVGRRIDLKPDVVWLDFSTSAKRAKKGAYKFHALWVKRDLPPEERPMGLGGENPAPCGVSFKFLY